MSDTLFADLVLRYVFKDIQPGNDDQRKAAFARMADEGSVEVDEIGQKIIPASRLKKGDVFYAGKYAVPAKYLRKVSGGHIVNAYGGWNTTDEFFIPDKTLRGKKVTLHK